MSSRDEARGPLEEVKRDIPKSDTVWEESSLKTVCKIAAKVIHRPS